MKTKASFAGIMRLVNIVFLIVLENFALDNGMGYYGIAVLIYSLMYMILMGSMHASISKMVNARNNRGLVNSSAKLLRVGISYSFVAGVIVSIFSYLFAEKIMQSMFGNAYAGPTVHIFAFVFLINAMIDVITGYFIGKGNALLNNLSQLLKTFLPIIISLIVVRFMKSYGKNVAGLLKNKLFENAYTSMGIAITYGVALFVVLIVVVLIAIRNREHIVEQKAIRGVDSKRSVFGYFLELSFKILFNQIFPLLTITLSAVLYLSIAYKAGVSPSSSFANLGILFAKVLLPLCFVLTIFDEYVNREKIRMHIDYRKDDYKIVCMRGQYMIKNTFFLLLPPTLVLAFLADPFVKVFYTGNYNLSAAILQKAGFLLLFAGLAYVIISILKAVENELVAFIIQVISFVVQFIFLIVMLNKSQGSSQVVLYSFYIYFLIQIVLGFMVLYKSIRMDLTEMLVKIGKYGIASVVTMIVFIMLDRFVMMNVFLMILSIVFGYLIYYLTIIALRGISKKDVQALKRTVNYFPVMFLTSRLHLW